MALFRYQQRVQVLLNDQTSAQFNPDDLTDYINTARNQTAAAAGCCRALASFTTAAANREVAFSSATLPAGFSSILNLRLLGVSLSSTTQYRLINRPFEWFFTYCLSNLAANNGLPSTWSQYNPGTAGVIYLDPIPDQVYTLFGDSVCLPSSLILDSDPEVIPYPWTDAIKYYAAYSALLPYDMQKAQNMHSVWQLFVKNAMSMSNATVTPDIYPGHAGNMYAAEAVPSTGQTGATAPQGRG